MFEWADIRSTLALAFSSILALGTLPASAQHRLERVMITGSSIKRIEGETALPVQIITRAEIKRSGADTVEQLLQAVGALTSAGGFTAASMSSGTTGGISAVSIHGLSSLRTLVLLNGRRIAPYGIGNVNDSVSVDVNSIPLAAIERIEILKDGASAVYGSDAIAGVVNFILRQDYKGAELTAHYGDSSDGGSRIEQVSGTWGFGDIANDRFNVVVVAALQKQAPLFARDRSFSRSGIRPDTLNDTTSPVTFPANILLLDDDGNLASDILNPSNDPTQPNNPICPGPYATRSRQSPQGCAFDPSPLYQLVPKSEQSSLFVSAKLALTNRIQAYLEASYNRNRQNNVIQPVPIAPVFLDPSSASYPTDYVISQTGGATPEVLALYRSAVTGNRDITDISTTPRLALGVKGVAAAWDFDAGLLHSSSKVVERVNAGFPVFSKILPLLDSGDVNFFAPNSADVNARLRATNFAGNAFSIRSTLDSLHAKASSELTQLQSGPLAIAFGVEARREEYRFLADPALQDGDVSGYGGDFLDIDKSRSVNALFGELSMPIASNVEATVAMRYDHYQGVGNSTTPKLSLRWQPKHELLLRGSVGKGFRAPSLQDLHAPKINALTEGGLSDPARCPTTNDVTMDCNTQFATTFGGNTALKPERSNNVTIGMVVEPSKSFSLALDAFRVHLRDTILDGIPAAVILGDLDKYGHLVTRAPAVAGLPGPITDISQTNVNVGRTRLSGIDFDAKASIPAGEIGKLTLGYGGTYFIDFKSENLDGSFSPNVATADGPFVGNAGGIIPRLKTLLTVNLARGPWNYTVAQRWQSGYQDLPGTLEDSDPNTNPGFKPRRVGTYETYDAQVQYTGVKHLRITLGMRNVFNRDPPYTNTGGQITLPAGYDQQYADPRGRFTYATLTYSFN